MSAPHKTAVCFENSVVDVWQSGFDLKVRSAWNPGLESDAVQTSQPEFTSSWITYWRAASNSALSAGRIVLQRLLTVLLQTALVNVHYGGFRFLELPRYHSDRLNFCHDHAIYFETLCLLQISNNELKIFVTAQRIEVWFFSN